MPVGKNSINRAAGARNNETAKFVAPKAQAPEPQKSTEVSLEFVPVESVYPSFSEEMVTGAENFGEILESVARFGILVPLLLRRLETKDGPELRVLWGHKRFYAAKKLGLAAVPAEIIICDDKEAQAIYFETTKDCFKRTPGDNEALPAGTEGKDRELPTYLL